MSVARAKREMSAREFTEWQAFAELEPFGDWRGDVRIAMLMSLLANINRDRKAHPKAFSASDFMPEFDKPPRRAQSFEEQWHRLKMAKLAYESRSKKRHG